MDLLFLRMLFMANNTKRNVRECYFWSNRSRQEFNHCFTSGCKIHERAPAPPHLFHFQQLLIALLELDIVLQVLIRLYF